MRALGTLTVVALLVGGVSGARGRFNETFVENADGSVTAKSDEVGPYTSRKR